jgi:uncharacterized protein YndB with AHSA1/START domain
LAGRTDRASRHIDAPPRPRSIEPSSIPARWFLAAAAGMTGHIELLEPRPGGRYRMTLTYDAADHPTSGKSSEHADTVEEEFVQLVADSEVVQRFAFESDDPAFAGVMTMTWRLEPTPDGVEVSIVCENVPEGISAEDHATGLASSLAKLAAYCEGRAG